jgi:hypothetical protein
MRRAVAERRNSEAGTGQARVHGWALVALGSTIIAGCATRGDIPPGGAGRSHRVYAFRGQSEHLEQLVSAGRTCGYTEAELDIELETPHLTSVVLLEIPASTNARFECVLRWVRNHPETGFRL